MERYNIVFATDKNYLQHTAVAIFSLLENNKELKFSVYYILDEISDDNKQKLENIISNYDCELNFIVIDHTRFDSFALSFHFNKSVYYRLLMAEEIAVDKILYLDSDIVINGNIKNIFDINVSEYFLSAVENPGFERQVDLCMYQNSKYFNAGVLYANLDKWRKESIFAKCVEYMKTNYSQIKLADQDVLNAVVNGNWYSMELKYNQQAIIFEEEFEKKYNYFTQTELKDAIENPIIIHYSGSSKPWHFRNKHPYKHLYWKYLKMTPFKKYIPEDLTVINVIKWILPNSVKSIIKKISGKI